MTEISSGKPRKPQNDKSPLPSHYALGNMHTNARNSLPIPAQLTCFKPSRLKGSSLAMDHSADTKNCSGKDATVGKYHLIQTKLFQWNCCYEWSLQFNKKTKNPPHKNSKQQQKKKTKPSKPNRKQGEVLMLKIPPSSTQSPALLSLEQHLAESRAQPLLGVLHKRV